MALPDVEGPTPVGPSQPESRADPFGGLLAARHGLREDAEPPRA